MEKIMKKRQGGRPPLVSGDLTTRVGFTVPKKFWDRVLVHAEKKDLTISRVMRLALVKLLEQD